MLPSPLYAETPLRDSVPDMSRPKQSALRALYRVHAMWRGRLTSELLSASPQLPADKDPPGARCLETGPSHLLLDLFKLSHSSHPPHSHYEIFTALLARSNLIRRVPRLLPSQPWPSLLRSYSKSQCESCQTKGRTLIWASLQRNEALAA